MHAVCAWPPHPARPDLTGRHWFAHPAPVRLSLFPFVLTGRRVRGRGTPSLGGLQGDSTREATLPAGSWVLCFLDDLCPQTSRALRVSTRRGLRLGDPSPSLLAVYRVIPNRPPSSVRHRRIRLSPPALRPRVGRMRPAFSSRRTPRRYPHSHLEVYSRPWSNPVTTFQSLTPLLRVSLTLFSPPVLANVLVFGHVSLLHPR